MAPQRQGAGCAPTLDSYAILVHLVNHTSGRGVLQCLSSGPSHQPTTVELAETQPSHIKMSTAPYTSRRRDVASFTWTTRRSWARLQQMGRKRMSMVLMYGANQPNTSPGLE